MESNDQLKEIDIRTCTCRYFDDILELKILILIRF